MLCLCFAACLSCEDFNLPRARSRVYDKQHADKISGAVAWKNIIPGTLVLRRSSLYHLRVLESVFDLEDDDHSVVRFICRNMASCSDGSSVSVTLDVHQYTFKQHHYPWQGPEHAGL